MLVKESPWTGQVVAVEYLGLAAPGCTEPVIRCQLRSSAGGTGPLDLCLSEQALRDLDLALERFETEREQQDAAPRQ